jgi:hypothetical protein
MAAELKNSFLMFDTIRPDHITHEGSLRQIKKTYAGPINVVYGSKNLTSSIVESLLNVQQSRLGKITHLAYFCMKLYKECSFFYDYRSRLKNKLVVSKTNQSFFTYRRKHFFNSLRSTVLKYKHFIVREFKTSLKKKIKNEAMAMDTISKKKKSKNKSKIKLRYRRHFSELKLHSFYTNIINLSLHVRRRRDLSLLYNYRSVYSSNKPFLFRSFYIYRNGVNKYSLLKKLE